MQRRPGGEVVYKWCKQPSKNSEFVDDIHDVDEEIGLSMQAMCYGLI